MRACLLLLVLTACRDSPVATAPTRRVEDGSAAPDRPVEPTAMAPQAVPTARATFGSKFRRGVSLGLFVSDVDPAVQRRWYTAFLDEIRDLGATDVQIVVRWSQTDVRAYDLGPTPGVTVDDAVVGWVLDEISARGMGAFVMPIVDLKTRGRGEWRGRLAPGDADAWWAAYGRFIGHYAKLAAGRAALFSVGSELVSLEREAARWRALIAETRGTFDGALTYSANWDHFEPIGFWDALDVVGVTAYQPLSAAADPDAATLDRGWAPFVGRLRSWAARADHRYLFTEVGYPANPNAASRPWDYRLRGAPAPDLQRRCFESLRRTWHGDPRLAGVYVWNWFGEGGPTDRGYTPRGKPAAEVLRAWFRDGRDGGRRP